ncbi:MAG: O-succinylbenzoate synthase [Actinomycetia bacterium]|nr:O-succinylbenzoate synthase [Actinomycetes bacterium]
MKIEAIELRRVSLPLATPFRTSHGTEVERQAVLVRVAGDGTEGWGECVAMPEPLYTSEYADGAAHVLQHHLAPRLVGRDVSADEVAAALAAVQGHPMAKAALEMAVLDAELHAAGTSFGEHLGVRRATVPSGISLGIATSTPALLDTVAAALDAGYVRVKLKVEPGHDVDVVRAVRRHFPDTPLQVDANGAYTLDDADHLRGFDDLDLLLLEQPLGADDLVGHAELARRLRTPICLDESITSARAAADAIAMGACGVVNVKPGRVGGYLEAVRVHDVCVAAGVPAWVGGMLETGLGRAGNVTLAALPGFTLPGDLSASDRWYVEDLTEPFVLEAGHLRVPTTPGFGRVPLPHVLAARTTDIELIR